MRVLLGSHFAKISPIYSTYYHSVSGLQLESVKKKINSSHIGT